MTSITPRGPLAAASAAALNDLEKVLTDACRQETGGQRALG